MKCYNCKSSKVTVSFGNIGWCDDCALEDMLLAFTVKKSQLFEAAQHTVYEVRHYPIPVVLGESVLDFFSIMKSLSQEADKIRKSREKKPTGTKKAVKKGK